MPRRTRPTLSQDASGETINIDLDLEPESDPSLHVAEPPIQAVQGLLFSLYLINSH
jgi:hypothetical protein